MARNQEKAMLLLNRFYEAKKNEGKVKVKRPYLATECDDVRAAEKWRLQVVREISRKVSQIQNPGLGEFRIRDLNDEINKLIREKSHWQDRIRELGGPDYFKTGPRMLDHEGKELPGNRGYKYFGAARDLPGVRELFEQRYTKAPRKTRGELAKYVDADYYGYRDEEDGVIVPLEQEAEKKAIAKAVAKWQEDKVEGKLEAAKDDNDDDDDIYSAARLADAMNQVVDSDGDEVIEIQESLTAHVPVPSQEEVEELLVKRKKMELLSTYVTESLQAQGEEARALLGYQ